MFFGSMKLVAAFSLGLHRLLCDYHALHSPIYHVMMKTLLACIPSRVIGFHARHQARDAEPWKILRVAFSALFTDP